jgi:glycosyltransferase involved in cell wall biosynthesis
MAITDISPAERRSVTGARGAVAQPKPLRVVHLLHTVAYGGVETLLINWVRALDPARVDVMVVCFANVGNTERPFQEAAERARITIKKIPWSRAKPVFRAASAFSKLLEEFDADIVHTHNIYAELVGWIAARRVGSKVMTTQYVWSDFGWKRNAQQWFAARLLRRFDLVTSQCETTMQDTIRRGVPARGQCVLVTGIEPIRQRPDPAERLAIRTKYTSTPSDVLLVNVARLYPEKAQGFLLECFAEIVRSRPQAKLWLMGVGPLEDALKQQAAALGLEKQVAFLGFVVDLPRTLLSADIQVHSSYAEGVPLAVCSGMAAGMPIVSTAVGGIPEVLRHEDTGLLVANGDKEAFVRETIRLIDDAALRQKLGHRAKEASETEFSLGTAASVLTEQYEKLARR